MADDYSDVKLEPWERNKKGGHIWWTAPEGSLGEHLFSFDKNKVFNLFRDYPNELTPEQKELFDKEETYWADFFKDRKYEPKNTMEISFQKQTIPKSVANVAKRLNFSGIDSLGEWNGYQVYKESGAKAKLYFLYDVKAKRLRTSTKEETETINKKLSPKGKKK